MKWMVFVCHVKIDTFPTKWKTYKFLVLYDFIINNFYIIFRYFSMGHFVIIARPLKVELITFELCAEIFFFSAAMLCWHVNRLNHLIFWSETLECFECLRFWFITLWMMMKMNWRRRGNDTQLKMTIRLRCHRYCLRLLICIFYRNDWSVFTVWFHFVAFSQFFSIFVLLIGFVERTKGRTETLKYENRILLLVHHSWIIHCLTGHRT